LSKPQSVDPAEETFEEVFALADQRVGGPEGDGSLQERAGSRPKAERRRAVLAAISSTVHAD
jgi:hypothetical protein